MQTGNGAISGKLVDVNRNPFDLSLLGDESSGPLKISLLSPDRGVVAEAEQHGEKPEFIFSDVRPGTYELSIYRAVPGKRTIAGSQPVTVNNGEIANATVILQVTEEPR